MKSRFYLEVCMNNKNKGMLVFPVIMRKNLTAYDDIAHGIFFEDISEGFEYMEEMDRNNDGSKYCCWSNQLIKYKKKGKWIK